MQVEFFDPFAAAYGEPPRHEKWKFEDFLAYYKPIVDNGFALAVSEARGPTVAFLSCLPLEFTKASCDFDAINPPEGTWYISDITVVADLRHQRLGSALVCLALGVLSLMRVPAVCARTRTDVPSSTRLLTSHQLDVVGTETSTIQEVVSVKNLHVLNLSLFRSSLKFFAAQTESGRVVSAVARSEADVDDICLAMTGHRSPSIVCSGDVLIT